MLRLGSKSFRIRISKKTRFASHLLASAGFIALFIWGWGLEVGTALAYLIICIAFLVAIIAVAAILGWLMRMIRRSPGASDEE